MGEEPRVTRANTPRSLADHHPGQDVVFRVTSVPHAGGRRTSRLRYLLFGVCFSCGGCLCFWAMP